MQASRLLSILMLLQARGRVTAAVLAQSMEVSERTILRDIDQLSAAGVPLFSERGRHGGFQLREGWSTQLTGLTEPESQALLLAGLPGPATDLGLGAAAASARLKMVASLPSAWREQADRVGTRLHIDPIDWYRAKDTPKCLREVADAVWHARRLSLIYDSWRGVSTRDLEPLGLVLKAGAWYVMARSAGKEAVRIYRLASISQVISIGRSFVRPRGFDLAASWRVAAKGFEEGLRQGQAHLRVSPRAISWLHNERLPFVFATKAQPPAAGAWQEVLMPMESTAHGVRQLLAFGAEVEVLAPADLRAAVFTQTQRLAALYAAPKRTQVALSKRPTTPAAARKSASS